MTKAPRWIKWFPQDALQGMAMLEPMEELAYRRLLDFIYANGGSVVDDDKRLGWMLKVGTRRWKIIRRRLIDLGKIQVRDGVISHEKAALLLKDALQNQRQKCVAGKASAEKRKALKNNETRSTAVATNVATAMATNVATNVTTNVATILDSRRREDSSLRSESSLPRGDSSLRSESPLDGDSESSLRSDSESHGDCRISEAQLEDEFARWWAVWPHKVGKGQARKAFRAARRKVDLKTLIRGIESYVAAKPPDRPYCHPSTWLHGERWDDEPVPNDGRLDDRTKIIVDEIEWARRKMGGSHGR